MRAWLDEHPQFKGREACPLRELLGSSRKPYSISTAAASEPTGTGSLAGAAADQRSMANSEP